MSSRRIWQRIADEYYHYRLAGRLRGWVQEDDGGYVGGVVGLSDEITGRTREDAMAAVEDAIFAAWHAGWEGER